MKRKFEECDDSVDTTPQRPVKRLSMFDNTPKQWKEQRRRILKMSKQKLKAINDVDCNLRKSVLINNTYRKMKRELRENNSPTSSWPYTPKSLFPNRPSSVVMCHSELEWESERHAVAMQFDDINSKELTPPAADLSIVLKDILGEEDKKEIEAAVAEAELSRSKAVSIINEEGVKLKQENCDIVDSSLCDSQGDDSVKSDSAKDSSVLSDTLNQDISNLGAAAMDHSDQSGSVSMDYDQNNPELITAMNDDNHQGDDVISDEEEGPINYSLNKRDNESNTLTTSNGNGKEGHKLTTSNTNEGQSMVTLNDFTNSSSNNTTKSASTIEDFIIGGQMDWSQNCDKLSLVYSSTLAGSMLPVFDLTNFCPFTDITSTYYNMSNISKSCEQQKKQDSVVISSNNNNKDNSSSCSNENSSSKFGFSMLSTEANSSLFSDITQVGIDLQQQKDSASNSCNVMSSGSAATTSSRDSLCSNMDSNTTELDNNCDVDINQHIWACFQQFNMAIACS